MALKFKRVYYQFFSYEKRGWPRHRREESLFFCFLYCLNFPAFLKLNRSRKRATPSRSPYRVSTSSSRMTIYTPNSKWAEKTLEILVYRITSLTISLFFNEWKHQQKLQRQLEFLEVQEEYIKDEQKNLKKELLHAQEEIKRIQSVPLVIGQFLEAIDQNNGIVGSTTGMHAFLYSINRTIFHKDKCPKGK